MLILKQMGITSEWTRCGVQNWMFNIVSHVFLIRESGPMGFQDICNWPGLYAWLDDSSQ
jgi:hypothetical protein